MSNLAKVYNDNSLPFEQMFKDDKIRIEPGKYIEMEWEEAIEFKSQFYPPQYDGSGNQKPESYKMIRLDGKRHPKVQTMKICAVCGDKFGTDKELLDHIDKNHLDQLEDQKIADKRKKAVKG